MDIPKANKIIKENGKKNKGIFYERVKQGTTDMEAALAAQWIHENKKSPGVNAGQGLLQDLFCANSVGILSYPHFFYLLKMTRRDRLVAATVVQFLGSNGGRCFLERAFDKAGYSLIKKDLES